MKIFVMRKFVASLRGKCLKIDERQLMIYINVSKRDALDQKIYARQYSITVVIKMITISLKSI